MQLPYEHRSEGLLPFGQAEQAVLRPAGINRRDWLRAVAQLSEYRLIDWTPLEDKSGMGLLSGFAKINDFGVKCSKLAPSLRSRFLSIRAAGPRFPSASQHRGKSAVSRRRFTEALEKVITAVNQAEVSEQEKNEAKSLLRKLMGRKAASNVMGSDAQSLAAKYFTE